jgi:AraC-like DNA-binding protein
MKDRTYFRYLPVSAESRAWGSYMPDAGYALIPTGGQYPPCRHPADHHFTWERGRVLRSFQLLYITRGKGLFESQPSGSLEIEAGDLFILFPEVWHRYRPHPDTGWDEHWVELDGEYVRRLMQRPEFTPRQPVLPVGQHGQLQQLFDDAVDIMRHEPPDYQFVLGALGVQIIAQTLSALKRKRFEGRPVHEVIREAKQLLAHQGARPMRLDLCARQLGISYSSFRRLFKLETGCSPRQFALHVCLERARDLLLHTDKPISLIAEELGFESASYFSRLYKQKSGTHPRGVRQARSLPVALQRQKLSIAPSPKLKEFSHGPAMG